MEAFAPRPHVAPDGAARLLFALRLQADLQVRTVYADLQDFLRTAAPKRVADVGCGLSPYEKMVRAAGAEYLGFDSPAAEDFKYRNPDAAVMENGRVPLPDASVDAVICTEVLEHVAEPYEVIAEMHRILSPGGKLFVTVPWSARVHYAHADFARYTPSMLEILFRDFNSVRIKPRGNDIATIASKCIVIALQHVSAIGQGRVWLLIPLLFSLPLAALALIAGRLSLLFRLGSEADPLGYTVTAIR